MGMLDVILNASNGGVVKQMANNFGISEDDTKNAISKMLPAIAGNLKKNMSDETGLGSLLGALQNGDHGKYINDPDSLRKEESVADGNRILGHILGSKDASRQVASEAAANTGIDVGILKKMLPLVAGLAMGSLGKQAGASGLLGQLSSGSGMSSLAGGLSSLLDTDGDGLSASDVLGFAKKLF